MPSSASRRKLADQQDSSDEDTDASSTSAHSDSDQSDSGAGRGDKKKAGGRDSKNVDSGREESDDEDGDDTEDEEKAVGGRGRAGSKLYEAGKGARGGDAKSQAYGKLATAEASSSGGEDSDASAAPSPATTPRKMVGRSSAHQTQQGGDEPSSNSKRNMIIAAVVVLILLLAGFALYWFKFRNSSTASDGSTNPSTLASNNQSSGLGSAEYSAQTAAPLVPSTVASSDLASIATSAALPLTSSSPMDDTAGIMNSTESSLNTSSITLPTNGTGISVDGSSATVTSGGDSSEPSGTSSDLKATHTTKATWFRAKKDPGIVDIVTPTKCQTRPNDEDYTARVGSELWDDPSLHPICGKWVSVWNEYTNRTINVTIQDFCHTCKGRNLDLSRRAFGTLDRLVIGVLDIKWWWTPPGPGGIYDSDTFNTNSGGSQTSESSHSTSMSITSSSSSTSSTSS